jgi:hypothetical protein
MVRFICDLRRSRLQVLTLALVGEAPQLPGGCALVHLPELSAFMAVAGDEVSVWDMAARRVATLRDHLLWCGRDGRGALSCKLRAYAVRAACAF